MALADPAMKELLTRNGRRGSRALAPQPPVLILRKPAQAVRLLGVDPGTRYVGWGVVERRGNKLSLIECGCIAPRGALSLKERLCVIFAELETVIARTRPLAAALEETFAGVNMKSAIAMGQGRGIALLCLGRANLEVLEMSPRSIKQSVTGNGAATKARVASMVAAQLNLQKIDAREDVTDALAAALALARRV